MKSLRQPTHLSRLLFIPVFVSFAFSALYAQPTAPAPGPETPSDATTAPKSRKPLTKEEQKEIDRTANGSTSGDVKKGDTVVLSPFEVTSDNKGYSASNSMAGTRLNSKLEDIAGSVSVVTKQQLMDTAALDINDIFLYEVGTEGTGQFTDLTNDGRGDYDNVSGNPTGANRMRGLAQAGIAVNGFTSSSSIPIDTYNINAVEISRGPNSNLAGLSDAGGTVNLVVSGANVTRESSGVTFRGDSYGGYRSTIDLNRPIIRDKLALRISAVYNEVGYIRKPSVDRTNRQQIALTYKPFRTTTISASMEGFHEYANRANSLTPRDTITPWRSRGRPTWDPYTFTATLGDGTKVVAATDAALPLGLAGLGSSGVRNLQYIDDGRIQYIMKGQNTTNATYGLSTSQRFVQSSSDAVSATLFPLFKLATSTDKSLYDWTDINLAAPNYEIQKATIQNVSIDQGILNTTHQRLDAQLAWRREDQSDYRRMFLGQQDGVPTTLEVDVNKNLVDGRPNPFFLHPFIGGLAPQVYKNPVFNDNYRAQLAYQLDMTSEPGWKKWIGLHKVVGYAEYRLNINAPKSLRFHDSVIDNNDFLPALSATVLNLNNQNGALFYPLYYLGKTQGGGVEYANRGPVNPSGKATGSFFNPTTGVWNYNDPVTIQELYFSQGEQKKKIRTAGSTIQSFLLNQQIVTTFGLRKDRVYTEDSLPTTTGANGFTDLTNLTNFGVNKRYAKGDTKTKGIVVKPFRSLAVLDRVLPSLLSQLIKGTNFYYNKSDSFLPADAAYNLYLEPLPNPTSKAEEYGININTDKLSIRLTHQDTIQIHTRAGTGTIATRALAMDFDNSGQNLTFGLFDLATSWQQSIHPNLTLAQAQTIAANQIGYTTDYINSAAGKQIGDASDAESKGWELEVQYNPNKFWTVKATGNQQIAIDSNISLFLQKFVDQRLPFWTTVKVPTDLLPDGTQLLNAGANWWTSTQGSNGMPVNYFITNIQNPLNLAVTTQGKRKTQTREYTLNLLSTYQLAGLSGLIGDQGWVKNMTVGGTYRWASKGSIGYLGGAADADGIVRHLDATKPVYDKATASADLLLIYRTKLFSDKIRASFQLNVKNVTESGHLLGVAVNPDGKIWNYRIIDPRQFILSASFDL